MEFVAKNVEKALEKASQELQLPIEKIEHDVVSYGSSGIFGLVGAKKAKIRVTIDKGENLTADSTDTTAEKGEDILWEPTQNDVKKLVSSAFKEAETAAIEERVIKNGVELIQKIANSITDGANVSVEKTDNQLNYQISGGNSAMLIGKRGQNLEAIQYITEKIVNKQNENRIRVQVDVEGYLSARRENLERLAGRLAEKAKKVGKPMTIGQMNAHDRRIVHLHLRDDSDVRTQSVGDGYYRKLIILPKKRKKMKRNESDR